MNMDPISSSSNMVILRHAHTDHNGPPKRFQGRLDVPLSEKGFAQARAEKSKYTWVKQVVASPALRVQQTVQTLFEDRETAPPVTLDANLWEIDNGWFAGKLVDEVRQIDAAHLQTWFNTPADINPGGGEFVLDMLIRAICALRKIEILGVEGTLIVTHGGIIRVLTLALNDLSLNDFHKLNVENLHALTLSVDNIAKLKFDLPPHSGDA